jgi:hypothetical protein
MTANLTALCRAYAEHAGLAEPPGGFEAEANRRLSFWPAWARLGAAAAAAAVRWASPLFILGKPRTFDALSSDDMDVVLARLQCLRAPAMRGSFLLVKTIVLETCYWGRSA